MELGIFARVPPEYAVRGFTEGERKPRAVPSLYRALALLCRLWANFAITEFSEVRSFEGALFPSSRSTRGWCADPGRRSSSQYPPQKVGPNQRSHNEGGRPACGRFLLRVMLAHRDDRPTEESPEDRDDEQPYIRIGLRGDQGNRRCRDAWHQDDVVRGGCSQLPSFPWAVRRAAPHRATNTAWSGAIRPLWDGRFSATQ